MFALFFRLALTGLLSFEFAALALSCKHEPSEAKSPLHGSSEQVARAPQASSTPDPEVAAPVSKKVAPVAPIRGPVCLPVARCHVFAKRECEHVSFHPDGSATADDGHKLDVLRVWPNTNEASPELREVTDYVDLQAACRRRPRLKPPGFACETSTDAAAPCVIISDPPIPPLE